MVHSIRDTCRPIVLISLLATLEMASYSPQEAAAAIILNTMARFTVHAEYYKAIRTTAERRT